MVIIDSFFIKSIEKHKGWKALPKGYGACSSPQIQLYPQAAQKVPGGAHSHTFDI